MEAVTYSVVAVAVGTTGLAATSHAAKAAGCSPEKQYLTDRKDYWTAGPDEKLRLLEADLNSIKMQASQQDQLIEDFVQRDEALKTLQRLEKELLGLQKKSGQNTKVIEATAREVERLQAARPKDPEGRREDSGAELVTMEQALRLQAQLEALQQASAAPPEDAAILKQLREENEQLIADNTQLHTNQDIHLQNQRVLEEDNRQLMANQQHLEEQLRAVQSQPPVTGESEEVAALKQQLMSALTELETQQRAHHDALQAQSQEASAQLQQLSRQLQDAEHRIAKLTQEKDDVRQQLSNDHAVETKRLTDSHVANSKRLVAEFEREYSSLRAEILKERRGKESAEARAGAPAAGQLERLQAELRAQLAASDARAQQAEARAQQAEEAAAALQGNQAQVKKLKDDLSYCALQRDGFKAHWEEAKSALARLQATAPAASPASSPATPSEHRAERLSPASSTASSTRAARTPASTSSSTTPSRLGLSSSRVATRLGSASAATGAGARSRYP